MASSGSAPTSGSGSGKVVASRKNYPGNRSDPAWQHGINVDGNGKKVQCKFCNKIVSGVYRLKHHLVGTKKDVEACISVPDDVREKMTELLVSSQQASNKRKKQWLDVGDEEEENTELGILGKGKGGLMNFVKTSKSHGSSGAGSTQSTINHMFKRDLREEACQQVARFFYTSAIPFNCIKNPEFIKMCEVIGKYGQGFKPPSYHEIREKYLKQEVKNVQHMLEDFKSEWKRIGCSIMSDGWTDRKRRSICNFLVNSPKGTVFLYSLDTSDISKTTDKVFEMLDKVVEDVGEEDVVQVITDNATNYKAVGQKLMEKRKHLYWTPCAAHCIDLMLEDLEKQMPLHKETISTGRRITTYIYGRTLLITMLRNFTKGRDLIRPAITRFATAYLTLACLVDNKGGLMSMFSSIEWKNSKFSSTKDGKQVETLALDNKFWKNIMTCLKAAAPLIKVLRLVDSDEKPAMGFIYDAMDQAKNKIKENFNNIARCYEPVLEIIDERWEAQLHKPLHAAAYFLNPVFQYSPNYKTNYAIKQGLYDCITRMIPNTEERNMIELQLNEFRYARGMFGRDSAKTLMHKMPPAEWWDSYGDSCPELQRLAIRILSLTCSSSGCERNWSAFEMIHTKRRNRLHQQKMNDLAYVMCNLRLRNKSASRTPVFEFDDIHSDDSWITEGGGRTYESNVEEDDEFLYDDAHVAYPIHEPELDIVVDLDADLLGRGGESSREKTVDMDFENEDDDDVGDEEDNDDDGDDSDGDKTFEDLC